MQKSNLSAPNEHGESLKDRRVFPTVALLEELNQFRVTAVRLFLCPLLTNNPNVVDFLS
jgi:hypothetical protein